MVPSQRYCTRCGAANQAQDAFCFACGQPLQVTSTSQQYPLAGSVNTTSTGLLTPNLLLKQRYRILDTVGKGGFGAVYKTEDVQLGNRHLAVKEMSQSGQSPHEITEAAESFKREALLLADLKHPNLPRIYEQFSEAGRWYLVMDFIEGETLEDHVKKAPQGHLSLKETLEVGIQLCTVLEYLHSRQPPIIFRDLKPSNSMLTPDGHLYLIDFGIARHFKPGQKKDTIAFGSPGYAAPEQYGKAQTTPRSDIYSLGATLYYLFTGIDPSNTPFQFAPLQGQPTSSGLNMLLMQMLEMNESKRPANIIEVKQQLQHMMAQKVEGTMNVPQPNSTAQSVTPVGSSMHKAQTTTPSVSPQVSIGRDQITATTVNQAVEYVRAQRSHTASFPFVLSSLIVLNFFLLVVLPHYLPIVAFLLIVLLTLTISIFVAHFTRKYDKRKTHVVMNYTIGAAERKNYERLCSGLEALAKVQRLRQVTAWQTQANWKQHAGARQLASFELVRILSPHALSWLETNIPVWGLQRKKSHVLFLPDYILIEKMGRAGVVPYQDLELSYHSAAFIEPGVPPADAIILRYTWRFINKNGTPDLRYRNNYQIPVTEATYVNLSSKKGFQLSLQASNRKHAEYFLECLRSYKQILPVQQVPQMPTKNNGSPIRKTKSKRVFKYPRGQNPFDQVKLDIY